MSVDKMVSGQRCLWTRYIVDKVVVVKVVVDEMSRGQKLTRGKMTVDENFVVEMSVRVEIIVVAEYIGWPRSARTQTFLLIFDP